MLSLRPARRPVPGRPVGRLLPDARCGSATPTRCREHRLHREIIATVAGQRLRRTSPGSPATTGCPAETGAAVGRRRSGPRSPPGRSSAPAELGGRDRALDHQIAGGHADRRCGWRSARWSSGPPAGWSTTDAARSTSARPSTSTPSRWPICSQVLPRPAVRPGRGGVRQARSRATRDAGVPEELASRIAVLPTVYAGADHRADRGPGRLRRRGRGQRALLARAAARAWTGCSAGSSSCRASDRWETMARAALRDDLHAVHAQLTSRRWRWTVGAAGSDQAADRRRWEKATPGVSESIKTLRSICDGQAGPGQGLGRAAGRPGPAAAAS